MLARCSYSTIAPVVYSLTLSYVLVPVTDQESVIGCHIHNMLISLWLLREFGIDDRYHV